MEITEEKPEGKVKKLIKEAFGNRLKYFSKGTQVYVVKDYMSKWDMNFLSVFSELPKVGKKYGKKISWSYDSGSFQLWEPLTASQAEQLTYSKIYLWEV